MAEPTRRRRRLALLRVIVVAELVVAMVTAAGVVFAYQHIDQQIVSGEPIHHQVERRTPALPSGATNILLLGTDSRSCRGCHIDNEAGVGGSDTTILLHVENGRHAAYGISIPRDTLVDRPRCTNGDHHIPAARDVMWNQAYAVGGPECTVEQVEAVTGIYVDSYITVDFGGFKNMVDAIHGVQVCIPKPVDDPIAHIHFDAGTQTLDGADALKYVRERHSTANSDYGRMKRQQAFIASMAHQVVSSGTLARPDRLISFLDSATKSLTVDKGLENVVKIAEMGLQFRDIGLDNIQFITIPNMTDPEDPNRLVWKEPQAKQVWAKIAKDVPLTKRLSEDVISAGNLPGSGSPSPSGTPTKGSGSGSQQPDTQTLKDAGLCT
jgi:LCP family protein required for cell wall assembly